MTNLGEGRGSCTSWLVGALLCGLCGARKGLFKKNLSAWSQGRGCGKLKIFTKIRLEGFKRYSPSVPHFFYRARAGFAWWVSQRTPAGQIWVVGPVVVGHRRYAHWSRLGKCSPGPLPQPPWSPSQAAELSSMQVHSQLTSSPLLLI